MKIKISINQSFTTMMTGHGNIKAYLHRFKLIDSATCPCRDNNDPTIDHIIYECLLLKTQRDNLRLTVSKTDSWPANKHTLISRHYSAFNKFINQIAFDELQQYITQTKSVFTHYSMKNINRILSIY
jgi:hypothetical protein